MLETRLHGRVSSSEAPIRCEDITFSYAGARGAPPVLSNFNLDVEDGTILCVLGPSGCGKTSLINLIAGFHFAQNGEITIAGAPVFGPGPDRGVVFQDYSLFPWLTAAGNVEFGLAVRGLGKAERRKLALAELARVGLVGAADRYPFELSGGMRQRVAIARTLAASPRVLLMDEPFAALDALTRSALQDELLKIQRSSRITTIFVTHNIAEAIVLGDRAIVIGVGGRIVDDFHIDDVSREDAAFGKAYARLARALNVRRAE